MNKAVYLKRGLFFLTAFFVLLALAGSFARISPAPPLKQQSIALQEWEFLQVDGLTDEEVQDIINQKTNPQWVAFSVPGLPEVEQSISRFIVRTKLPQNSFKEPSIMLEMYDHAFNAYQHGQIIYSFGTANGQFPTDVVGNALCFIPLKYAGQGEYIYLDSLSLMPSNTAYIKEATFSSQANNILAVAKEGFSRSAISLLLAFGGLVFIFFYKSEELVSFLHIGLLSISVGSWFFFDSNPSLSLMGVNPLLAQYIGLLSMFLAPIFFGVFIGHAFKDNTAIAKLINIWTNVSIAYVIGVCILDTVFKIRLIHTLFLYHLVLLVWVILAFVRVFYSRAKKQDGAATLALACAILTVAVLTEVFGLVAHISILQLGHVSYAMVAFIATLGYLPIKRVAMLNRQVYEYSVEIAQNSNMLEKIILALSHVLEYQTRESLVFEILDQLLNIINTNKFNDEISSVVTLLKGNNWKIISQTGSCNKKDIEKAKKMYDGSQRVYFDQGGVALYFTFEKNLECIIYVKNQENLSQNAKRFVEIYHTCVYAAYNNLRLNREIISSQENIIYALGNITESRSQNTGQHIQRVAQYTKLLASQCYMDEKEVELVKIASSMHDIGKLGIPDSILNKPGKLTEEEYETMKKHAEIGYDVLSDSKGELMQASAIIALQHHEKFDGNGYPEGLSGKDIHIYARIVAIADVFDALLTERPYKKPWKMEDVLAYFQEESGKHFDPELVDILIGKKSDFMQIREAFPDSF